MSDIAHHLVRRAVQMTHQQYAQATSAPDGQDEPQIKQLAAWGIVLLWVTGILYLVMVSAVNYTYGEVVATLAMIETPTATAVSASFSDDEAVEVDAPLLSEDQKSEKENLKDLERDLFLVKQPLITDKLRTAVKHLRAVGGRLARFRGFQVAVIYHMVHGFLLNFLSKRMDPMRPLTSAVVTVLLWQFPMLWTHIVVSNPSSKRWYQRFPSRQVWRQVIPATASAAFAQSIAVYVPAGLAFFVYSKSDSAGIYDTKPHKVAVIGLLQLLAVTVTGILCIVFIVIPAEVVLKRVQASMLPEEDETIVPFDRSFGGRVQPQIVGGSGCVTMRDAWATFDKDARFRLFKVYAKVFAIQIAAAVFFLLTIVGELRLIMGDDFNKAIKMAHEHMNRHN